MEDLHKKSCVPCKGGVLPFDISEIHKYLKKINGWNVKKNMEENFFLNNKFLHYFFLLPIHQFFSNIYVFQKYQKAEFLHDKEYNFFGTNHQSLYLTNSKIIGAGEGN